MGICKNCKWWEPHQGGKYEGFCRLSGYAQGFYLESWKIQPRDVDGTMKPSVWAKHDEVRTSPDFGCNQWEWKIERSRRESMITPIICVCVAAVLLAAFTIWLAEH